MIDEALYGLRNFGTCFHSKWADSMVSFGFSPSRGDPDVCIKDKRNHSGVVAVYSDDLLYAV